MRPHLFRGTPPEFGDGLDDGCVAVAVEDLEEARLADMQCCGLRLDIADALVRHPDVGGDDRVDFRVERALLKSLTGGSRRPSCSTAVADAEKPPGTAPPMSGQWPVFDSQQKIFPSR